MSSSCKAQGIQDTLTSPQKIKMSMSIHHSCRLEFTNQAGKYIERRRRKKRGATQLLWAGLGAIAAALLVEKYISELAFSMGLSPQN